MADINSKFDIGVTTGPIRGSRKVQIKARQEVVHVLPGAVEAIHRVLTRYSSRQLAIKLSEQWRLCG